MTIVYYDVFVAMTIVDDVIFAMSLSLLGLPPIILLTYVPVVNAV